jgi:spore coat polysaccharide biosynthesis predicted glycosyltransferase SpsG/GNAT superfamily N-acetyltransferase
MLCDGGESLGVGHVIRSLALAEAAVAAGHDVVVAGQFEGFSRGQVAAAPVEVVMLGVPMAGGDPRKVIDLVRTVRPDVLHVDSYGASDRLRDLVASAGVEVGVEAGVEVGVGKPVFSNMEDGTFGRRPADVVVDPTFGAALSERPEDGSTWLLRGSRYTPLRQRVVDARRPGADTGDGEEPEVGQVARSVLVVMGGTDPVGLAPVAVDLLARTGLVLEVTAIAVRENGRAARAAAQDSALSLTVVDPVDDLATLMARHDLVISAAGTSVWELCCIGVPTAALWAVDNQRAGYDRVVAAGAAVGLGGPDLGTDQEASEHAVDLLTRVLTDSVIRADLVRAGRRVVDGLGAWRVVRTWEQADRQTLSPASSPAVGATGLVARPATLKDARLLWQWRNDPATRAGSRSSAEVPWDDHLRWLTDSLTRTDRLLFVAQDLSGPVGTVRWDLAAGSEGEPGAAAWEVSITVAPQRRGQSLGHPLLRAGERALLQVAPLLPRARVPAYLAVVHRDNVASVRLFESSGYVADLPADPQGFMRFRKTARVP